MLILGKRSKRNSVTGLQPMSMEALLQTTVENSLGFDPAVSLGRIHSILSALIQHCKTRAAYLYTGSFTCELHIRPGGHAFVSPVVPDIEAKLELLWMWELVWRMDVPSGALTSWSLPKLTVFGYCTSPSCRGEPGHSHLQLWVFVASLIFWAAFDIYYNVFWEGRPIAMSVFLALIPSVVVFAALKCY